MLLTFYQLSTNSLPTCYWLATDLLLLALPDVEEEEAAGGEDDAVGLGAGGRGGHHPPVLVPGVGGLGAAVRLAVEGEYSTVQYSTVQYSTVPCS